MFVLEILKIIKARRGLTFFVCILGYYNIKAETGIVSKNQPPESPNLERFFRIIRYQKKFAEQNLE